MLMIRKMGPIANLLKMLPGGSQMSAMADMIDEKQLDRVQAIIRGMTPLERNNPKILNASRRRRIANGSGVTVTEVNQLIERFFEAKKMMGQMANQMGLGGGRSATKKKPKGRKGKNGKRRPQSSPGAAVCRTWGACRAWVVACQAWRSCRKCRNSLVAAACPPMPKGLEGVDLK